MIVFKLACVSSLVRSKWHEQNSLRAGYEQNRVCFPQNVSVTLTWIVLCTVITISLLAYTQSHARGAKPREEAGKQSDKKVACVAGDFVKIRACRSHENEGKIRAWPHCSQCRDTSGTFMCGPRENSKSIRMPDGQTIEKMTRKRPTARAFCEFTGLLF